MVGWYNNNQKTPAPVSHNNNPFQFPKATSFDDDYLVPVPLPTYDNLTVLNSTENITKTTQSTSIESTLTKNTDTSVTDENTSSIPVQKKTKKFSERFTFTRKSKKKTKKDEVRYHCSNINL
jgi:hypothetical protein